MFKGFNIKDVTFDNVSSMKKEYIRKNRNQFFSIKSDFVIPIELYLKKGFVLDGNALMQEWFPSKNRFDIFISHSGDDEDLSYALAEWLYVNFNLTSFIDSLVWKHCSSLKRALNSFFFEKYGTEYNSLFKDRVNQHILLMLNTSLMEVMDRCECLFFLNTPQSVEVSEIGNYLTDSPWLFSEIGMFNSIQKKQRRRILSEAQESTGCFSNIQYKLNLSSLNTLDADDLNLWANMVMRNKRTQIKKHPLDTLYNYCSRKKK